MLGPPPARDQNLDFRQSEHYPVFDVLRIVAGLMVIYSHSFVLVGRAEPVLVSLDQYHVTVGHAGVAVFFVLSGYLVTQSWLREPASVVYSLKRFARIWPAYTLVVVLAALVLGPIVTTFSLADYFSDKQTWVYIGRTVFMSPVQFDLPGVFVDQPVSAVNGSLWTLPYEVLAYAALLGLGVIGVLRRRDAVLALAVVSVVGVRVAIQTRSVDIDAAANGISALAALNLGAWFLLGAALFLFRRTLRWSWPVAGGVLLLGALGVALGESLLVLPAASYLLIFVGTRPWAFADVVRRPGDPSYGIYLFAFPVQQTLVWSGAVGTSPAALLLLSAPLAVLLGYASWHVVEKPAMVTMRGWVRRLRARAGPRPAIADG